MRLKLDWGFLEPCSLYYFPLRLLLVHSLGTEKILIMCFSTDGRMLANTLGHILHMGAPWVA